jgi:hypothetical protein
MSAQSVRPRGRSANIFINYRREDSSGHAGRLFDALSSHFAGRLFMDIDTLQPGVDFVEAIEQAVDSCQALIVVIGREWLTIHDPAGHRRLDDPADFVRLELESALARNIRVIPVLVQDAPMPRADELPPSLSRLARRNAIELSDARWAYDVDRLARTIKDILEEKDAFAPAHAPAPELATPLGKAAGPRVWLFSLAALALVAAVVAAAVLWPRRTPIEGDHSSQGTLPKLEERVAVSTVAMDTKKPEDSAPKSLTAGATGGPITASGTDRAHDQASTDLPAVVPLPKPRLKPKVPAVKVPLDDEPSKLSKPSKAPAADVRATNPAPVAPAPPPRATITSPANGDEVGDPIPVQGTVQGLGDQRIFLCIRQKNGALYPRGELFPKDGQWSINLRRSKEDRFEILVVSSASREAAQALSDQKSRDDGLPVLPAGASISGDAVAVKRQGKFRDILGPKH